MALSPQYSWPEPDNSSLVKNGAQDIRALGDAIDTSVWNVGFGQAGKNKVINGDFSVNQRAFTSTTVTNTYMFDRFRSANSDGTSTFTAQTFTPGTAPVAGYEGKNYLDIASTGQTLASARTSIEQRIEDVRLFAGQTATVSFWAKAASGTPSIAVELLQVFGTGGSGFGPNLVSKIPITTSWVRYSATFSVPSVAGATIGASDSQLRLTLWTSAGSDSNSRTSSLGIQTATISIWGVQAESGAKATPFQLAGGGSPQAELALCQRYYERLTAAAAYERFGTGFANTSTTAVIDVFFKVPKRAAISSSVDFSTTAVFDGTIYAVTAITVGQQGINEANISVTVASGLTTNRYYQFLANNSTSAHIGFSAEL
jgi:hypothetical protein